jgi:hypothetical protein
MGISVHREGLGGLPRFHASCGHVSTDELDGDWNANGVTVEFQAAYTGFGRLRLFRVFAASITK